MENLLTIILGICCIGFAVLVVSIIIHMVLAILLEIRDFIYELLHY